MIVGGCYFYQGSLTRTLDCLFVKLFKMREVTHSYHTHIIPTLVEKNNYHYVELLILFACVFVFVCFVCVFVYVSVCVCVFCICPSAEERESITTAAVKQPASDYYVIFSFMCTTTSAVVTPLWLVTVLSHHSETPPANFEHV